MIGVGPVVSLIPKLGNAELVAELKWLPELQVENRLKGDSGWLTGGESFQVTTPRPVGRCPHASCWHGLDRQWGTRGAGFFDYGDVMVHVFQESVRQFNDFDGLWRDAPEVALPEELAATNRAAR